MKHVVQERGWRGSAELWLDAAYQVLVESGVDQVKVGVLAERLGLSRTSFYWHFADREALLAGLIARWQAQNTAKLVAQAEAPAATISQAILNIFDCWIDATLFDSRLEFAIRTWALNDAALEATIASADATRIAALAAMFRRFGYPEDEADIRAHTVYLTQIGYISMRTNEAHGPRLARMPAYALTFTGQKPTEAELAAFRARHPG